LKRKLRIAVERSGSRSFGLCKILDAASKTCFRRIEKKLVQKNMATYLTGGEKT